MIQCYDCGATNGLHVVGCQQLNPETARIVIEDDDLRGIAGLPGASNFRYRTDAERELIEAAS